MIKTVSNFGHKFPQ